MTSVPIRYAHGNLLFDHTGRTGALYRLATISYGLLPDADKWAWMTVMCAIALRAKADFSIHRVTRRYPASDYVSQAESLVDCRYQDPTVWRRWLESHESRLAELDSHVPEVYLRVSLEDPTNAPHVLRVLDRAGRRVNEAFGVATGTPITQRELHEQLDKQDRILNRLRDAYTGIRPATIREVQWLCRRASVRHVDEPLTDPWWTPDAMVIHTDNGVAFKPMPGDTRRLFSAGVRRERDHLVVVGEGMSGQPESYQAFLTLGMLPHQGVDFPGLTAEVLHGPVDAVGFPVDAVLHCEWVTNQRALKEVRRKLNHAEDRIREALKAARSLDNRALLNPELARELEQILMHESHPPMFDATVSYAIGAPSLDELTRRVDALRERLPGVTAHRPPGEQERLYHAHHPAPASVVTDWAQRLTLDQMGMMMPIAGREIGDQQGVYFAYTTRGRSQTPVKRDPGAAARDALPPTEYVVGRQGAGKTLHAMLAGMHGAMGGAMVLTADPGPDHFIANLPEFEGQSAIVSLNAEAETDRGMLDPLVAPPLAVQEDVALSYYLDLLPDSTAAGQRRLMDAIKRARMEHTGSLGVIDALLHGDDVAVEVGHSLQLFSDFGLGRLGFSDGRRSAEHEDVARVTTFTMANLGLPSAGMPRALYDRRQQIAVATFKLLAAHIMGIVTRDRSVRKDVILDEGWVFDGPDGQQLLDSLVRLGRKHNARVILCSQTVGDLGSIKSLIGSYFIFGVNDTEEAKRALALIGLDPDDEALCAQLADKNVFRRGLCLHRDQQGRVEVIQIDPVHQHVLDTLSTSPTTPTTIAVQEEVVA
jgi:hypothetical protein